MSALKYYLDYIRKFEPLAKEEEKVLFKKAKVDDHTPSYEKLINCNLRTFSYPTQVVY